MSKAADTYPYLNNEMDVKAPRTWGEAVELCTVIMQPFIPKHKRITPLIGFYIEPAQYADCPYVESPQEALKEAEQEDENKRIIEEWDREHKE